MPGLLNMDPTAAGLIALGGGMVRGDFGGGLLGFSQATQSAQDQALRQQLGQANIADLQQQMELRKAQVDALNRKNTLLANFLGGGGPGVPSQPAMPGQLGSGSFGVVAPPAGQPAVPSVQSGGQGGFVSRLTPDTLAALKLGADADLTDIYKLTQPDMQVSNGYAYDRRKLQPGFIPQANVSQNGQATVMTIGPDGMPRVSAPTDAVETYSNYRNADEAAKAGLDLVKVVGADGAERYVTRAQAARAAQGPQTTATPPRPAASEAGMREEVSGPMGATPADYDREITASTQALQYVKDPASRAQLQQHIAEMQRQKATYGPMQASPTTAQAAARAKELKQAETDVRPTEQRQNEIAAGNYMLSVIDRALQHPGLSEATGLQGTLDPRNYIPGTQAKDFQALHDQITGNTFLQAYANLKGGGQITEVEGKKATDAIARLNRAQSTDSYRGALNDLRSVVTSALDRQKMNLSNAPVAYQGNGASGSFAGDNSQMIPKQTLNELPKMAAKGARVRDTQTGKVLQFNGLSWVEVK